MKPSQEKQAEYYSRHKERNPSSEMMRKRKQRRDEALFEQRVGVCMVHLRRELISRIPIPESVDRSSAEFIEADKRYSEIVRQVVIKEVVEL